MSENQEFTPQEVPEEKPAKKPVKWWLVGGCSFIGLLLAVAVALFVFFDPFGLVGMLLGGGEIAAIVPDDVMAYVEIDLLAFMDDDLQDIIEAFEDSAEETDEEEAEDFLDSFEENFGVTIDDITPWVGQYVGVVLEELDFDQLEDEEAPPMVVILESRDKDEADAFIADVIEHREDEFDEEFEEDDFDRAIFYDNDEKDEHLILGRYRNYLFIATDEDVLEDVLYLVKAGRRAEDTLAESEMYQQTLAEMPEGNLLTLYLNYEKYQEFYEDVMDEADSLGGLSMLDLFNSDAGFGVGVSVVEEGIRVEVVTVYEDPEGLPWSDLDTDLTDFEPVTPAMLPEETFLFFSFISPAEYMSVVTDMADEDTLESMELLEDEIGISIEDIYASVEGEITFALFEQDEGFLAEFADVPLGVSFLIGINDDSEWGDLFGELTDAAGLDGMTVVEDVDLDGYDLQSVGLDDGYSTYPFIIYGTGNDFAILSTMVENAEILAGEGDTLADSDEFQEIWESFPENEWPFLYLNVEQFASFIEDMSDSYLFGSGMDEAETGLAGLEPLTVVAAASTMASLPDRQLMTIIFFIDR